MMLVVLKQNKQHIGLHSSLFLKFMISLSDVDILMYNQVQVMWDGHLRYVVSRLSVLYR